MLNQLRYRIACWLWPDLKMCHIDMQLLRSRIGILEITLHEEQQAKQRVRTKCGLLEHERDELRDELNPLKRRMFMAASSIRNNIKPMFDVATSLDAIAQELLFTQPLKEEPNADYTTEAKPSDPDTEEEQSSLPF